MGLIKVSILTRGRVPHIEYIDSSKRDFIYNQSLYIIPNELCLVTIQDNLIKEKPQLFYIEDRPYPLSSFKQPKTMKETLNDKVLENFMSQASKSNNFNLMEVFKKIGWKNFLIGLGVALAVTWILTSGVLFKL